MSYLDILKKNLSQRDTTLTPEQTSACVQAMYEYAFLQVERYRRGELYDTIGFTLVHYPGMLLKTLVLWIRKRFFLLSCRQAQLRADTEGYKIYVILSSRVGYTLLSTREVDYNKKIKVLGKKVSAKELTSTSAFIAYPKSLWQKNK